MKYSTKDLHEKFVLGHTINEISDETGIGRWAIYKRFQRLKCMKSTQENNSEHTTINENIISNTKPQIGKNKWSNRMFGVLVFAIIFVAFFLYREYNYKKIKDSTK